MSIKVKICGITCENDIRILNGYLPEYAGFVFAESKRRITADRAKNLMCDLDPQVKRAGVFVNMDVKCLAELAEKVGLDVVQLNGDETQDYIDRLRKYLGGKTQIWKAIRISGEKSLNEIETYKADIFLADTYVKGIRGGSGTPFDWKLLQGVEERKNVIMAGGLTPDNISEAISIVRPYGVDVSSGVEIEGKKNEELVGEFIKRAREI